MKMSFRRSNANEKSKGRTGSMNKMLLGILAVGLITFVPWADAKEASKQSKSETMTQCTVPRPQICTRDFRPVCAKKSDGTFKTFSNACTACSDPAVIGHREGKCEEEKSDK